MSAGGLLQALLLNAVRAVGCQTVCQFAKPQSVACREFVRGDLRGGGVDESLLGSYGDRRSSGWLAVLTGIGVVAFVQA